MAYTCSCTHQYSLVAVEQTLAFSPANASLPLLWLSSIDLSPLSPCSEGTGSSHPHYTPPSHTLFSFYSSRYSPFASPSLHFPFCLSLELPFHYLLFLTVTFFPPVYLPFSPLCFSTLLLHVKLTPHRSPFLLSLFKLPGLVPPVSPQSCLSHSHPHQQPLTFLLPSLSVLWSFISSLLLSFIHQVSTARPYDQKQDTRHALIRLRSIAVALGLWDFI